VKQQNAGKYTYFHQLKGRELLVIFNSARSKGLQLTCSQISNLTISNNGPFRVLGFAAFNLFPCLSRFLAIWVLARTSGCVNRLLHIREDLLVAVKENTADFTNLLPIYAPSMCFLRWKFDIMRLFTSIDRNELKSDI
jgi:hypothetical protein